MTKLNRKYIKTLDYYKLNVHISEYKESLNQLNKEELKEAKKVLSRLERYKAKIIKRDKIETIAQMNNRKLDKHIK